MQVLHCSKTLGAGEAAALASLPLRLQDDAVKPASAVQGPQGTDGLESLICISDLLASVPS